MAQRGTMWWGDARRSDEGERERWGPLNDGHVENLVDRGDALEKMATFLPVGFPENRPGSDPWCNLGWPQPKSARLHNRPGGLGWVGLRFHGYRFWIMMFWKGNSNLSFPRLYKLELHPAHHPSDGA